MLAIHKIAPDFVLSDQDGKEHKLSDYKGNYVLIYFYPKDKTPGCTREACSIRDTWHQFEKLNLKVLGISKDSIKSHKDFSLKQKLPFTLLSDPNGVVIETYEVWKQKSLYGKTFMGINRMSYLIDKDGKILKIYEKVNPDTHAEEVLADVKSIIQ